jgi:hypothetical protein
MPALASAPMSPPPFAPRRARADDDLDYLDMPAFLRRDPPYGPSPYAWPDEEEDRQDRRQRIVPPSPPPAPTRPWSERLDELLNTPAPTPAALIVEMRKGLVKLEALGGPAAALVREGLELIALLESEQAEEGRKRLPDWLRRVRELLAQPAARRWRGFWWR